ncbi:MAG: hypothetical protein JW940_01325 [Polyangiaceae bacterium]|nr:hypothetical protein [Polyangiaceae bacterium]
MHGKTDSTSKTLGARTWHLASRSRPSRARLVIGAVCMIALAPTPSAGQQRRSQPAATRAARAGVRIEVDAATMEAVARLGADVVFFTSRSKPLRSLRDITDRGDQVGVWGMELFGKVNRLLDAAGVAPSASGQDASLLVNDTLFSTLFRDSPNLRLFVTHTYSDGREQAIVKKGGGLRLAFRSREKPAAPSAPSAEPAPAKAQSVVYSGTTRCAGMFVTVSFVVDRRRRVSRFKADHGCAGEPPRFSWDVPVAVSLDSGGGFRADDSMGGSMWGVVDANSASGKLSNSMRLQCKSDGRFRDLCEDWSALPSGDAASVLVDGQTPAEPSRSGSTAAPASPAPLPPYTLPPDYSKFDDSDDSPANRERLAYRKKFRLTAHLMVTHSGLQDDVLSATGGMLALGYRQNLFTHAGLHVRLGAGIADVWTDRVTDAQGHDADDSSASVLYEGTAELVPYAGPLSRFYAGPILWLAYRSFAPDDFTLAGQAYAMPNGWLGGAGLDMGFLALAREQLDINLRVKTAFNGDIPLRAELGIGWHFFP